MLQINGKKETDKIISFLQGVFHNTNHNNVVIGWSGGIDSSVCLYLLVRSMLVKNIYILHLPYTTSYIKELKDLRIKGLNIKEVNIKKSVDEIWGAKLDVKSKMDKIRLGNIMARVRMILLFDWAKKVNGLVCGTENKTEHLLGYYTRFGDGASDIEPILHLYKTQVYQLAQYMKIPDHIINKSPSANLWEGQTDEGEFGFSYQEADEVLYRFVDTSTSLNTIQKQGFVKAKKIVDFMKKNQF